MQSPSRFIEFLPAKAYVRPEHRVKETTDWPNVEDRLPTREEIERFALKRRSSSTSTASSIGSMNDGDRGRGFLTMAQVARVEESEAEC